MRISTLLITIFLISGFVSGFIGFYGSMISANSLTPYDFTRSSNTTEQSLTLEMIYNISEASQNTTAVSGSATTEGPMNIITGGYNIIMQVLNMPVFFGSLITDMTSKVFGIPLWFQTILYAIISIVIIAAIVNALIGGGRF